MPSKERKPSRPDPSDDPSVTKYKLFASSKRTNGIKVKEKGEPKVEDRQTSSASQSSQQHYKNTHSQYYTVISDSESDGEGGKADSNSGPMIMSSSLGKRRVIQDDDDEGIEASEASSSRQSRGDNRAICSRGKVSTNMQVGKNGHIMKVSSFKPLPKRILQSSKVIDEDLLPNQASRVETLTKGKGKAKEETVKADLAEMFRGMSDSGDEEFHEPAEVAKRNSNEAEKNTNDNDLNKKGKLSEIENDDDEDNEDDNHIDSVLGQAIQSREVSTESEAQDGVTREEFDKAMRELREEMKQEMDRLKSAIRIETKRLVRTEVKDEIALAQEHQT